MRNRKSKLFHPKPGQVDFTRARYAPVINCVVKHKNKILLVKRSRKLNFYPGYWNSISGFLDDQRSLGQKVKDELKEELGIPEKDVLRIHRGGIFEVEEPKYKKVWIVHPVLIEVKTDRVELNWEADDYKWVKPAELSSFNLLPGFDKLSERLIRK